MIAPTNQNRITIPALENGDMLSRAEFERRYTAMPHLKKAELIEGIVYMASPLRFEPHAEPHANLLIWLGNYVPNINNLSSSYVHSPNNLNQKTEVI